MRSREIPPHEVPPFSKKYLQRAEASKYAVNSTDFSKTSVPRAAPTEIPCCPVLRDTPCIYCKLLARLRQEEVTRLDPAYFTRNADTLALKEMDPCSRLRAAVTCAVEPSKTARRPSIVVRSHAFGRPDKPDRAGGGQHHTPGDDSNWTWSGPLVQHQGAGLLNELQGLRFATTCDRQV